ncbi:MAG TPA: hypothetical protein VD837_06385 [Terriglobales bacterium]|nr:hypothetical protein [Terriglobales bacterium]
MFEEELKLEKESKALSFSSPFLYIFLIIILVVGGVAYWMVSQNRDVTPDQAKIVLENALKARGPATVHFHLGAVKASVDEKPRDPHYKLLEKAGFVKLGSGKDGAVLVNLTPLGEGTFAKLPEFQKAKNPDGTDAVMVPLATRELAEITKVEMTGVNTARVEYVWKWKPNKVGEVFDATGATVKGFSQWDRATLIKNYGVDFYREPQKGSVNLVRSEKGWKIGEAE